MNFEWKVINAEVFTQAQDALNQLDREKFEVVTTHCFTQGNQSFMTIVARKHKQQSDIRY